ncbi:HAD-IA family hydrolase [Salinisphaera sp. G21_0]|uniref:HAD-IA family hydrolase n=1 Tax=Salinisphaera sp. G21_0 TaxID=2821094 RepID=UPI001AD9BB82|nr:HAD-IA family hydrolase [Salinisphaera sp. G21_0]MBO9484010.1 HAD-IA family hydrolase [Salinisphaera sp. G21_0]
MFSSITSINKLLLASDFNTLSLDIFDTLLLRKLAPEKYRFRITAKEITCFLEKKGWKLSWLDVYKSRLLCSRIEYQTAPLINLEREGRLKNILALQLKALRLPSFFVDDFAKIELEQEKSFLIPNRKLIKICKKFLDKGKRIILVSDMYLDGSSIIDILEAYYLSYLFDSIYVSSDYGITKSGGSLFDYITNQESLDPSTYIHIGDNYDSDYISPKKHGWSSIWLPRPIAWRLINRMWSISCH